MLTTKETEV